MDADDAVEGFALDGFLPYLLAQAAETTSARFASTYRDRYGMHRTDWRVLFHLGTRGSRTATEVARAGRIHKTKVSRALARLEAMRFVARARRPEDRRVETLALTAAGWRAYRDLRGEAEAFERRLLGEMPPAEVDALKRALARLADLGV